MDAYFYFFFFLETHVLFGSNGIREVMSTYSRSDMEETMLESFDVDFYYSSMLTMKDVFVKGFAWYGKQTLFDFVPPKISDERVVSFFVYHSVKMLMLHTNAKGCCYLIRKSKHVFKISFSA